MKYRTTDRTVDTPGVHTYQFANFDETRCVDCENGICEQIVEREPHWQHDHVLHGQRVLN